VSGTYDSTPFVRSQSAPPEVNTRESENLLTIRPIRPESSLAKSNRLTGNRFAVGNNMRYEIAAIRVDSHDSSRIAPAKSNRLTGSRLELGNNWGCEIEGNSRNFAG